MGHWSCVLTIQKWIAFHDRYNTYVQQTLLLLSAEQKSKHIVFLHTSSQQLGNVRMTQGSVDSL